MSSAYFAPLVTLPDVITEPGFYETRRGNRVIVTHTSTKHDFGCVGQYLDESCTWVKDRWHKSGRLYAGVLSDNDIVRKV